MDALADLGKFVWRKIGQNVAVESLPGLAGVAGTKRARRGNPARPRRMVVQAVDHLPVRAVVAAAKQHPRIAAKIHNAGFVGRARSDVPDALERGVRYLFQLIPLFSYLPSLADDAFAFQAF